MNASSTDAETVTLAGSLTTWLAPIKLDGLTSRQTTALLTERVAEWGRSQGWSVHFEAPIRASRPTRSGESRGRLDVVCRRDAGRPPVVIEIDRGNKRWSVDKLASEAAAGAVALWVRWRDPTNVDVPDAVGLVDLAPEPVPASTEQIDYLIRLAHRSAPTHFSALFAEAVRDTNVAPRSDRELFRHAIGRLTKPTAKRLIGLLRQAERERRGTSKSPIR